MDPTILTYYGGIALGCLILIVVLFVYMRSKELGAGGVVLTLVGFSLVGLSIWNTLDLNLKEGHVRVELRSIEKRASSGVSADLRPSVVNSARYKVAIVNFSALLGDKDIEPVVSALQKQVSEHISPVWGVNAQLTFIRKGAPVPTDSWILSILDNADDTGSLGYHDISTNGLPIGKVFVANIKAANSSWSVVASHELVNMLVDPRANLTVFISSSTTGDTKGTLYAIEIATPCGGDENSYEIDGIRVSNFVYPSWFEPTIKLENSQFDHQKRIKKPLELCPQGYALTYEIKGGNWRTIFGKK